MRTSRTRIARTLADQTLKSGLSKKLARQIAAYLLSERRVGELNSLLRDVQADWAEQGYVEVMAASAHPLSASARKDIERQVRELYPKAKTVVVTEVLDPEVLGGVRIDMAGRQLDLSVEAKLNKFKQLTTAGKE